MARQPLENVNVVAQDLLPTPAEIKNRLPAGDRVREFVLNSRKTVQSILERTDPRLFVVVGPCSIHDLSAAEEYARKLEALAREVRDTLFLIMRVYFEKPRTSVGWKGYINDPFMDDSFHIEEGVARARQFLLDIATLELPAGTEALDPIMPQYLSDLVTWTAIGARTTESQTHREMASGLSTPLGFKNGTDGSLAVAINALRSAASPHSFLGISQEGQCAVIRTRGNQYGHVVLRGGSGRPNYGSVDISICERKLNAANMAANIVVDCSHANSNKDYTLQPLVMENCINQILEGNRSIIGLMIESNLESGNQPVPDQLTDLRYGVSVTDPCIDWQTTARIILEADDKLRPVLAARRTEPESPVPPDS
jgi:3-deoxy-7-phosphoheptulonate synthase